MSILLPVYNGAAYLGPKLDSLLQQDYPPERTEILVCLDGCTDDSELVLRRYASATPRIKGVRLARRAGKPSALNLLRQRACGEILVLTDARQPVARDAVAKLVDQLSDSSVGCVSGNLVIPGASGVGLYWRYETFIRRAESGYRGMLGVNGSLYAVRRTDLEELPSDILLDDMWIPMCLRSRGKRTILCEDAQAFDQALGTGRELERKIRTLAGNYQLFARLPTLLVPRLNPLWFETLSHKVMRLVCPWALLFLLPGSVIGTVIDDVNISLGVRDFVAVVAAGQVVLYSGAILGARAGRIGVALRTFVTFNMAALIGLWRFLRHSQRVTW